MRMMIIDLKYTDYILCQRDVRFSHSQQARVSSYWLPQMSIKSGAHHLHQKKVRIWQSPDRDLHNTQLPEYILGSLH